MRINETPHVHGHCYIWLFFGRFFALRSTGASGQESLVLGLESVQQKHAVQFAYLSVSALLLSGGTGELPTFWWVALRNSSGLVPDVRTSEHGVVCLNHLAEDFLRLGWCSGRVQRDGHEFTHRTYKPFLLCLDIFLIWSQRIDGQGTEGARALMRDQRRVTNGGTNGTAKPRN